MERQGGVRMGSEYHSGFRKTSGWRQNSYTKIFGHFYGPIPNIPHHLPPLTTTPGYHATIPVVSL